jgi:BASS family bile acid:Na+ symporter
MNMEEIYKIVVLIFTVANLAAMGLEINPKEALEALKNPRFVLLILVWGWVVGPGLAYLITQVIPLSEPHAAGLLLISMAPTAPFFPLMVSRARGDMSSAGAFILVATIGTVVFLPLQVPLMIKGLAVDAWALAKPLLTMVLVPLLIGLAIKVYRAPVADKLLPVVKKIGTLFLLITAVLTFVLYGREMLSALGSFAVGTQLLLFALLTSLSYRFGFGLKQGQRSAMALGMCTRNIAAVFVAYFGITNPDPGVFVMIVLVVPLALIVALIAARVFAKQADSIAEGVAV